MENIVELKMGAGRTRHEVAVPPGGASILLFTGVRYVRERDGETSPERRVAGYALPSEPIASDVPRDLAAH